MKKKLLLILLPITILAIAYWLFSHAYVEIVINNPGAGNFTYSLLDQRNQKTSEVDTAETKIKKLVRRGSHEVLVKQGETSYFSVVKAGGFLAKTTVQAKLSPEKNRKFVGDNPGPCTHYVGQTLISFACGATYNNIQVHIPATTQRPTFTRPAFEIEEDVIEFIIEGVVKTKFGSFLIVKKPGGNEYLGPAHIAFPLNENFQLTDGIALSDLDENQYYTAQPYKEGFVVYNSSFDQIFYYASVNEKPTNISIDKPKDQKLQAYMLSVQGESIIVAYAEGGEEVDLDQPETADVKSEVVIFEKNEARRFTFKKRYASAVACGSQKLCLLLNKRLDVYDVGGQKPRHLFMVGGIDSLENTQKGLVLVRGNEVLGLDAESREGSIEYSFGDYGNCGIQKDSGGYLLCLTNSKRKKVALFIDQAAPNSDSIDKKIAQLLELDKVKDVSIYDRFIFISPNAGPLVYLPDINGHGYDPQAKQQAASRINQEITELGIDKNTYTVINTLE